ncbi:DUF2271 domain-containing protein [Pseudozobellia thermophila]|uniref:Flagellin biosynthesis protein FlgD n=1 Tax=Pseudozobellia thermophila TaxID=192903 RepID=A0A1M6I968_9FLAO|nr:DUF2271 domain-containing protein [Pseudozobellia thermophila]SHJ30888.1 Predicted protein [Pseudozobellia thermophila]
MKPKIFKLAAVLVLTTLVLGLFSFVKEPEVSYKCMIQMTNYTGEKAYVVVSLINPEGEYEKTLYIQGDDREWFPDLKNWWKFSNGSGENVDALSGATIGNGERNIISLGFSASHIDAGYKVRFESAVENQEYYAVDAEIELNSATLTEKVEGQGYIRYIRMVPNR